MSGYSGLLCLRTGLYFEAPLKKLRAGNIPERVCIRQDHGKNIWSSVVMSGYSGFFWKKSWFVFWIFSEFLSELGSFIAFIYMPLRAIVK